MAKSTKKGFLGGVNTLLGAPDQSETIPNSQLVEVEKSPVLFDETRATFILNAADLEKLKAVAYWDRLLLKEVVAEAITQYLTSYEKKNGAIKPVAKKR